MRKFMKVPPKTNEKTDKKKIQAKKNFVIIILMNFLHLVTCMIVFHNTTSSPELKLSFSLFSWRHSEKNGKSC